MGTTFLPPATTTESTQRHPHRDSDKHVDVFVLSTIIPVCAVVSLLFVVSRRIIRRRIRTKRLPSIFVLSESGYNFHQPSNILIPDIVRVTSPKIFNRTNPKETHEKDIKHEHKHNDKHKKKNNLPINSSYPREPIYKSQQMPSYLVPFTALPPNFDFSLDNVEVHSDFVIIKDMDILQTYWHDTEENNREYQKQSVHNPNFT